MKSELFSLYALLMVAAADIVLLLWCWLVWKQAQAANPSARLQFRIIDLWFLALALSPTLSVATQMDGEILVLFLLLMIPHQIAGAFIFRLDAPRFRIQADEPTWKIAVMTVSGTLLGWIMPILTLVIGIALLAALALILISLPISLPLMLIGWLIRRKPANKQKAS